MTARQVLRIVALSVAMACVAACSRAPKAGVTELVYATPYGPNHPFSRADKDWMDFVERESGGRIAIRPVWSGALLSSEHSMVELRHGVADIGLITPIYTKAGTHLIRIQSGFYSDARTPESQLALYRCMAAEHAQLAQEVEGLKVLAIQGGPLPGLLTRSKPVRRLEDLKGLRIRSSTELLPVLQSLGADPVNMPMGEVYSALAKGIIDGVFAPPDTFRSLHFSELAPYFTRLYTPRGAYPARAMGARRWAALSAADQAVLEASIPVWEAALSKQTFRAVQLGLETARDAKVEMIDIDPAAQKAFDDLYLAEAAKSAAALSRYRIDGPAVFHTARASLDAEGSVHCRQGNGT